jgi:exonuclease III
MWAKYQRKKTPFKQARLDLFLFPDSMLTNLVNCKIEPSYRSDHSMVIVELEK